MTLRSHALRIYVASERLAATVTCRADPGYRHALRHLRPLRLDCLAYRFGYDDLRWQRARRRDRQVEAHAETYQACAPVVDRPKSGPS